MADVLEKKEEAKELLIDKQPKEPLLSKKNRKLLNDPLNDNNPITVQVLGICSALAITVKLTPHWLCLFRCCL